MFSSCSSDSDDIANTNPKVDTDTLSEEWYAGGKLGTVFDTSSSAYQLATSAVNASAQLTAEFMRGITFFAGSFVTDRGTALGGLGPVYVRNSCITCHSLFMTC